MGKLREEEKDLIKKFLGKRVTIKHHIDYSYHIDGDPQYNRVAVINGDTLYNAHRNIESISRSEFDALKRYGSLTGQYTREPNGIPNYFDVTYTFVPSEVVLESL